MMALYGVMLGLFMFAVAVFIAAWRNA